MKTVEVKIYEFNELPPEAKEHALEEHRLSCRHSWGPEFHDTVKAFEKEFNVRMDYEYDPYSHRASVYTGNIDDAVLELKGNRARAWFWNNHGRLLLEPRTHYWTYRGGKLFKGGAADSRKRRSKCFFTRVYDGTCPFTGVCFDNDILDPMAFFCFGVKWDDGAKMYVQNYGARTLRIDNLTTVSDVLWACAESAVKAASADWAYQLTEEYYSEHCDANEIRFTEDGEVWTGAA